MTRKRVLYVPVLMILAAIIGLPLAAASASSSVDAEVTGWMGPELRISPIQDPDANRRMPAVAYNSAHQQYLVVWHNEWPGSADIYGQRLDSMGRLLGPWFAIATGQNYRMSPTVAYNAIDDEYMIVFMVDPIGDQSRFELKGERINWDGTLIGSAFTIVSNPDRSYYSPRLIWKESYNEYMLVYGVIDTANDLPIEIGEYLMNHEGGFRYATTLWSTGNPSDPDVVWEPNLDRYLMVWSYSNGDGRRAIMGDFRDGNANRVGSTFDVYSTSTNDVFSPRVGSNGIWLFVTFEYAYSIPDHDIYGAWVTKDAGLILPAILAETGNNEIHPAIISSPSRAEMMVLYEKVVSGVPEVWLWPISPTIPAAPNEVCRFEFWDCINPAGAWGPGGYMFTFSEHSTLLIGNKYHIYGRFFSTNAVFLPLIKK